MATLGMKIRDDKDELELREKNLSQIPSTTELQNGTWMSIKNQINKSEKFL